MIIKNYSFNTKGVSLPLILVFLFIVLTFSPDVTKLKNLCVVLMVITAIMNLFKDYRLTIKPLNNVLFFSICIFTGAMIYSVIISIDPMLSLTSINKPVFNSLFLFSLIIPMVLYKEQPEKIAKLIIFSFATSLFILLIQDSVLYIENYRKGILAFSDWSHRSFSDGYVFFFPVILCLWNIYKKNNILNWSCFLIFSSMMIAFMLGTLSRGAWLAALIMGVIAIIINKEKTLFILSIALIILTLLFLNSYDEANKHPLTQKLEQTDSSARYKNGTQGTALELIILNPIKGYGFGNEIFHRVYNEEVKNHPEWIFTNSLGPHNVFLAIWFAAGLAGIISVILMVIAAMRTAILTYNNKQNIFISQAALLLATSFIGWFIIRGSVENVYLNVLGIHFGLLIALSFSCKVMKMDK